MTHLKTVRRPIAYIVVVNPPGFRKRWRDFKKLLDEHPGELPPIVRLGVNQDHLTNVTHYPGVTDLRTPWARVKLKLGLEPRAVDIVETYGSYLQSNPSGAVPQRTVSLGQLACTISHILVLEHVAQTLKDDEVALVVEDDCFPNLKRPLTHIEMPEAADVLVYHDPQRSEMEVEDCDKNFTRLTQGYGAYMFALNKKAAINIKKTIVPVNVRCAVDGRMWHKDNLALERYRAFCPRITDIKPMIWTTKGTMVREDRTVAGFMSKVRTYLRLRIKRVRKVFKF